MDPAIRAILGDLCVKLHESVEIEVKQVEDRLHELQVVEAQAEEIKPPRGSPKASAGPVDSFESRAPEEGIATTPEDRQPSKDTFKERMRNENGYEQAFGKGLRLRYNGQKLGNTSLGSLGPASPSESCMKICARLGASPYFDLFWALVIASNGAFLGIQLTFARKSNFLAVHVIYAMLFALELFLRIMALGPRDYFLKRGWSWNWVDAVVVVSAWVSVIFEAIGSASDGSSVSSSIRLLNLLRVSRLLRIVKTLWIVRFVGALRTLVTSLVDTFRQLFWAMLLLLLIIYIAGVLFTDVVLEYTDQMPDPNMQRFFGSLGTSLQTLFRAISGGFDWAQAADTLLPLGTFWVQVFHFYVGLCTFALLNVMIGCFCESAIKAVEKDHENRLDNRHQYRELLTDLFHRLDDGDGQLTLTEFEKFFENEKMRAFLESADITAIDAWTLFANMDMDGNHVVDVDEFTNRCLSLRGTARSMDVFALTRHSLNIRDQLTTVQKQLAQLLPDSTSEPEVFAM